MNWKKNEVEDMISRALEDNTLEQILEDFDLDPVEVMVFLYQNGMLDDYTFEEKYSTYVI